MMFLCCASRAAHAKRPFPRPLSAAPTALWTPTFACSRAALATQLQRRSVLSVDDDAVMVSRRSCPQATRKQRRPPATHRPGSALGAPWDRPGSALGAPCKPLETALRHNAGEKREHVGAQWRNWCTCEGTTDRKWRSVAPTCATIRHTRKHVGDQ